jgi:hypothetical protein
MHTLGERWRLAPTIAKLPFRKDSPLGHHITGHSNKKGSMGRNYARPRAARRWSGRRADTPRCGRRASPQAPPRRAARAYASGTGRITAPTSSRLQSTRIVQAEAPADVERRLDDDVAREARRDRFEIRDFAGRGAAGHSVPPRSVARWVRRVLKFYANKTTNGPACIAAERGLPSPSARHPTGREKAPPSTHRACRSSR